MVLQNATTCSLCDSPAIKRGWCGMHYQRWRKHGDPNVVLPSRGPGLDPNPTYWTVHLRLSRWRGKAADYPCVDCEQPALHWSYKGGGGDMPYSANLDDYEPRCSSCHQKLDRQTPETCSVAGCILPYSCRGMCNSHYQRWYKKNRVANRNTTPRKK